MSLRYSKRRYVQVLSRFLYRLPAMLLSSSKLWLCDWAFGQLCQKLKPPHLRAGVPWGRAVDSCLECLLHGVVKSCKRGVLENVCSTRSFFKHRVWVNKTYQSLERSGKSRRKSSSQEIVSLPTSKSIYLYNQMIFPSIRQRAPDVCVHHCLHLDLRWRLHVQPVENEKGASWSGNVFFGSRKLLLPCVQIGTIERVSLLLKAGALASPFLLVIGCFLAVVSIDESLEFIAVLNIFSWNVGIVSFASLTFTFLVGCRIDEWLRTLRSFRLMSTSGWQQVETKQFHPRCADMLQMHWSSLHMLQFQHVYIHMNMHVKMHMKMHMYKPVTHTISSAKPHGVILRIR